jgi:hypothetical protein
MDFDIYITDLHKIYAMLFLEAETPEAFLELWGKKKRKFVQDLIKEKYPEDSKNLLKIFNRCQKYISSRLQRVKRIHLKKKIPVFVTDQEIYTYIRKLHQDGKVFPIRGDLTQAQAMKSISDAARNAKLAVRVVYMSNAEQYFKYSTQYRKNFQDMFIDDKSLVLRTMPSGDTYHYYIQKAEDFNEWLANEKVNNVRTLFKQRKKVSKKGAGYAYEIGKPPEK